MIFLGWLLLKVELEESTRIYTPPSVITADNVVSEHLRLLRSRPFYIKHDTIVMCQEILETDWFRSTIYSENRNRFGMKINSRPFAKAERRGHALYDNYEKSIEDYAAWQKMRLKQNPWVKTDEDYLNMLIKVGYAEDPRYKEKLLLIRERLRLLAGKGPRPEQSH